MTSMHDEAAVAPSDCRPDSCFDGTLVFRLGYDGARFSGFAEQPGQLTVAGELRRALETFLRREIELTCAGRTDAGVHAISQYVSVPALASELEVPRTRWMRAMAALLPDDIALSEVYHPPPASPPGSTPARAPTPTVSRPARPVRC